MLLAGEQEIADRIALAPSAATIASAWFGGTTVLLALEEDHRLSQPIRVIKRRALAVARFLLG